MNKGLWNVFAGLCGILMMTMGVVPAGAQAAVKAKPPMYSYVADWQIPRAHWGEMAQSYGANKAILDKELAAGTIVGYGSDEALVHQADGETHDNWWSAMSMAGLMKVLEQFYASGNSASPALESATKHWDEVLVSRYYHWRPGAFKNGYVAVAEYKLKADAPSDALEMLSGNLVAPMLEKLVAEGTLQEYEIDEQAVHTGAPGTFSIIYIATSADGLDKVDAAIQEALKNQPLSGPAFGSMVDRSAHRDELLLGEGTYK